jgi:putative ABC transport system ATP-binding protein
MIEVRELKKVFGKGDSAFVALDNVSLEIPDGKTAAIVGKSGSGKSTLLHLLGGLESASSGQIIINGQDITKLKGKLMDRFRSSELGFVFQAFFVEANQTCYQNVALPLEISQVPFGERKPRVEEALAAVDLSDKLKVKAANLSGGEKQRLAIARAIVNKPSLIFADEPTGNLDSVTGEKIIELLFDLHKERGSDLIIVTHDHDLAARCDVQIHIVDGKVMA